MASDTPGMGATIGRGILAGLAGTALMTAFQKFVEMPLSEREDSYAPAMFAQKVLGISPGGEQALNRQNYATHFGLGTMWGAAYGVAAHAGLRGAKAVTTVFIAVYTGDVLLNTALGLYEPSKWSRQELVVDVVDKFVQAAATGAIYDRWLAPDA